MATDVEKQQLEGARTQSLFREVNERIETISSEHRVVDGEVLCECANGHCTATIALTLDDYEAVRAIPTHFIVAPGHEVPEIERVVVTTEHYAVVEKFGDGGLAAVRLDPRRRRHEPADQRS